METLASFVSYGFGILGMICLGMAFFVKLMGSAARAYQIAEAPAESDSTGGCFFTTMVIVLISVSLAFFFLAVYISSMVA